MMIEYKDTVCPLYRVRTPIPIGKKKGGSYPPTNRHKRHSRVIYIRSMKLYHIFCIFLTAFKSREAFAGFESK